MNFQKLNYPNKQYFSEFGHVPQMFMLKVLIKQILLLHHWIITNLTG